MIVSNLIINAVAKNLSKHFNLDKIVKYVFEDNELDKKTKELEGRIELLEVLQKMPRKFKCDCGKEG